MMFSGTDRKQGALEQDQSGYMREAGDGAEDKHERAEGSLLGPGSERLGSGGGECRLHKWRVGAGTDRRV